MAIKSAGIVVINQESLVDKPNCPPTTSANANPLDQKEVNMASSTRTEQIIRTNAIPMPFDNPIVAISVTVSDPRITATVNAIVVNALRVRPPITALFVSSFFSM